jgi:hypothetical protein
MDWKRKVHFMASKISRYNSHGYLPGVLEGPGVYLRSYFCTRLEETEMCVIAF